MVERKERFALLSRYEKYCKLNNIFMPPMNKYNEQWAADALLESFTFDQIDTAMQYYFSINPNPTWKGFANNVDRLLQSKAEKEEDQRLRAERRAMAKEWLAK